VCGKIWNSRETWLDFSLALLLAAIVLLALKKLQRN